MSPSARDRDPLRTRVMVTWPPSPKPSRKSTREAHLPLAQVQTAHFGPLFRLWRGAEPNGCGRGRADRADVVRCLSLQNGNRRDLYSGIKGKTRLQPNTINSGLLKTIFASSAVTDDSDTIIGTPSAIKPVNDTTFSASEIIIEATPIIISGPDTLIFIPDPITDETPAIISDSEILISGRPADSRNQQVADLPRADTYFRDGDTYFRGGNDY